MRKIVDIREYMTLTEENTDITVYDSFLEDCVVNSIPERDVAVIFDRLGDDEIELINKRWRQLVQEGIVDQWLLRRKKKQEQEREK